MPSFAIEAVPEATPLNEKNLLDILRKATTHDQQQLQTSAQQLTNWETQPGFYSGLQSLFTDLSLPLELRHLAIITLKNGIERYWRKTAPNAIGKDEKSVIRSRCVQVGLQEPTLRLALQNAVIVAKITRHEFPQDWPDALTSMTQVLREANGTVLPRILLILLYVVKELSTAKIRRSQVNLYNATPDLFRTLCEAYVQQERIWMGFIQSGSDDEVGAIAAIEHSLLALRAVRRLIVSGYQQPAQEAEVQEIWTVARSHFGQMYALVREHGSSMQVNIRGLVEKHLVQIAKLHLGMIREHPTAFPQLPDAIGIAQSYWGLLVEYGQTFGIQALGAAEIGTDGDAEEIPYMEKLSLKALLLLRACLKMAYGHINTLRYIHGDEKSVRAQSRENMKDGLLSDALVREMMETLVVKFFVFRPRDLREWETEPDEWERTQEGEGESWEHSVRICAEKLFLDLVLNNKDLLIQPLLEVFNSVATTQNTDVLVKDSVYAAIGLSAPILNQHLDFDAFLKSTLVPEVQIQAPGYNLLRRRIAIVIGQWITVKDMDRALVYQIFQYLLDPSDTRNDLVVRVTAGRQLKNVMDPWDIKIQGFTPYVATIIARLLPLISEVVLAETKLALLNSLSTIVVRMEHYATPFAEQVLSALPPLWEQADDEYLIKQTILGILSKLMSAIRAESQHYHSLILPIISSSLDPESETRVYLIEDALDLWSSILTQAVHPTPDLISLAWRLRSVFESASENFLKALEIEELYVVLDPAGWLNNSGDHLKVYAALNREKLSIDGRHAVLQIVDLFVQQAARAARLEPLMQGMHGSGLLSDIMTGLRSANAARQTTGPNRLQPSIDDYTETSYCSILARILYADARLIESLGTGDLAWFIEEWLAHFDSIPHATHKKLNCLGLTALLGVPEITTLMLRHLQGLLSMWTHVLRACCEVEEDESLGKDSLVYERHEPTRDPDTPPPAPDEVRRQDLLYADPVHSVPLTDYIRTMLQRAIAASGGHEVFHSEWLVNVDQDVLQSFGHLRLL